MPDITRVYLITGFLGSGKTTFLNRIIKGVPQDVKLTIMMNEFGEIGVDGALIEGDALDIMEISKGSIFCACVKTDFIKGLYELYKITQPDILLIEPTGVANPTDLKRDLELPIFNNHFDYREQFCLIDCAHFIDAHRMYASLEKQIASSSVFIMNKTDLASPTQIENIKDIIREFNPNPIFFETTYAQIPFEKFFQWKDDSSVLSKADSHPATSVPRLSDDQLDLFINNLLDNPNLEITPPDCLMSMSLHWKGRRLDEIRTLAQNLPPSVVRAKGLLMVNEHLHLFSYVMGDWTVAPADLSHKQLKQTNIIVLIGPPESMSEISHCADPDVWTHMGVYRPQV